MSKKCISSDTKYIKDIIDNNKSKINKLIGGANIDAPYVISLSNNNKFNNRYNKIDSKFNKFNNNLNMSPTSGSEPSYEPSKWNNNNNIKYYHNCYAYVLNGITYNRKGKPQPGYFSNFPPLKESDYKCPSFEERLKKDNPSMYVTNFNKKCKKGFYKGFLALDTKKEDQDYHFYRQDSSGLWSHKPGRQDVVNYDADNKKILNPEKANRNYKHFNYSKPCFFFCLNPKLSRSHSK